MPATQELYNTPLKVDEGDYQAANVDAIIIGAGIAGLTAAHGIHRAHLSVLVFEASDSVGGAIRTLRSNGYLVECGPNTLLDTHPEVATLIEEVSLSDARIFANDKAKKRFVVRNGVPVPLPTSAGAFLRTPLFSTRAKLRLTAEPFIRKRRTNGEESIASFTTRRLGKEFLDYAIDPFVSGVYAGRPERLSVQHAFPKLGEIEERYGSLIIGQVLGARERKRRADTAKTSARMFSFENGLDQLPLAIADALGQRIRTRCRVRSINYLDPNWQVEYEDASGRIRAANANSVVYASGLQYTSLIASLGSTAPEIETVDYPPLNVVALGFRTEDIGHALDGFGLLVPACEDRFVLGALFSSTLFDGRAPVGHALITAFVGGARSPDNASLDDADLLSATTQDLTSLLQLKTGPVWHHISRWPKAIPQYNLGYGSVKAALNNIEERHPGLFFAGNYLSGISVAESIRSGVTASEHVESFIRKSQPVVI